jgi:hypothetical protein
MARLTHLRVPTIVLHGTLTGSSWWTTAGDAGLINASRYAELPGVGDLPPTRRGLLRSVEHTDEVEAIGNEGAP